MAILLCAYIGFKRVTFMGVIVVFIVLIFLKMEKNRIGSVVNVITNIALVKLIGVEGVVISTIIVMAIIYFPWETKVLFDKMFTDSAKEYCLKYYSYALVTIVGTCVTYWICNLITIEGIPGLLVKICICAIVPNILFVLVYFKTTEFKDTYSRIMNLIGRSFTISL